MEPIEQSTQSQKNWYDKSYKILFFIPIILTIFSVVYLWNFQAHQGDIIRKDVSLTGGTSITVIDSAVSIDNVKSALSSKFSDISIRKITEFRTGKQEGFIVESQSGADALKKELETILGYSLTQDNSSIEFSGATTSQGFYQQLKFTILITFILMGIVVFVTFRTVVPSCAVMLSAFSDIIISLAVVNLFGMTLSMAGVIAFLLLIGYSVDTDVVLTTQVLKNKEAKNNERIYKAFKTGITMTLTSISAILVSLIVIFNSSPVLKQMFTILLIGLVADLFTTWLTNASMIKWYVERKEKQ
jgi:preprotein translocase subunit SecF